MLSKRESSVSPLNCAYSPPLALEIDVGALEGEGDEEEGAEDMVIVKLACPVAIPQISVNAWTALPGAEESDEHCCRAHAVMLSTPALKFEPELLPEQTQL